MTWVVLMTKPNHEAIASENLKRQGYEHYCPRYQEPLAPKDSKGRFLFPRYIFVLVVNTWHSLRGTRGVSYVLMTSNGPQPISNYIIEDLKNREDKNGFVQLARSPKFEAGAKVRLGEGSFAGRVAVYEGMTNHERCSVLMDMLGRQVRTEISERSLVAA